MNIDKTTSIVTQGSYMCCLCTVTLFSVSSVSLMCKQHTRFSNLSKITSSDKERPRCNLFIKQLTLKLNSSSTWEAKKQETEQERLQIANPILFPTPPSLDELCIFSTLYCKSPNLLLFSYSSSTHYQHTFQMQHSSQISTILKSAKLCSW